MSGQAQVVVTAKGEQGPAVDPQVRALRSFHHPPPAQQTGCTPASELDRQGIHWF
jgi:hypothetical protein